MTGQLAWVVAALCAAGCGNEIRPCEVAPETPAAGGEIQLCHGGPHDDGECAYGYDRCDSGGQCGSGLACAKVSPDDPCFTPHLDEDCRCRPVAFQRLPPGPQRLALQRGFLVGGMPSSIDVTESPPRLTWQAPEGARLVACALFSCAPSFRVKENCSPTDEIALFEIDNFEQCVLLFGAFPATQPGFILSHENAYPATSRCDASELGPRVVTELAAGCWAYDTTSIVAATELHPIQRSMLAGLAGLAGLPQDATCAADGDACYEATADMFGVCLGGACRPRCRSRVDCSLADPAPAAGGTCGWACQEVPGQELGACVPKP